MTLPMTLQIAKDQWGPRSELSYARRGFSSSAAGGILDLDVLASGWKEFRYIDL